MYIYIYPKDGVYNLDWFRCSFGYYWYLLVVHIMDKAKDIPKIIQETLVVRLKGKTILEYL